MANPIYDSKQKLQTLRHSILYRVYDVIFLISFIGGSMTSIFNNGVRKYPMWLFISILFVFFGSLKLILVLLKQKIHTLKTIDHILFAYGCLIYFFLIGLSSIPIIFVTTLIFPSFLLLFITLLRRKQVIIFLSVNLVIVTYLFYQQPIQTTSINSIVYILAIVSLITAMYISVKLIGILNNYQDSIYNDNKILSETNLELTALNEEYFATQEELHNQYDQIQYFAYNDELTGLFNRNGFHNNASGLLTPENLGLFLIYIDIENFSEINSAYGYEIGDQVLKQVSERIVTSYPDAINPARVGNDIFAFIVNSEQMETQLHQCLESLKEHYSTNNDLIILNFKVGIAIFDDLGLDIDILMSHADIALTKSKATTAHNIVVFDSNMKQHFNHTLTLKTALSSAIKNKDTYMVYQPIINSSACTISGYESLVRWVDDSLGFVSPGEFIPLAESTHLIEPLGELIICQVLEFIHWNLDKLRDDLVFSINISGIQLSHTDFATDLLALMNQFNVSSKNIAIEITETSLINDFVMVQANLLVLKKAGIKIYLDDFGTGYSSLNYLDQLPIDVLKIDQSFCNQVLDNEKKNHLLQAIIALANKLEISTVAEGVETLEQYEHLKAMGINKIQGYYFSKPLTADIVTTHFEDFSPPCCSDPSKC